VFSREAHAFLTIASHEYQNSVMPFCNGITDDGEHGAKQFP
jgi:hypothetical protein